MITLFSVLGLAVVAGLSVALAIILMMFRVVVPTNEVHIVQSSKATVWYGSGSTVGNTYYKWPSWIPRIGRKVSIMPLSVFDVSLDGYAAYDKGRVPFVIDIMAFFRVTDPNLAAQRVHTVSELVEQLGGILQGACRTILASHEIEEILEGRSQFGDRFTKEVDEQLQQWGVQTVKMIELMDIRDAKESRVISNIMAKKQSLIDRQSREVVAENKRAAETAEIEAEREVQLREQEAQQAVGQRTAEKDKQVGIANEQAKQEIKVQAKVTAERDMEVVRVQEVRKAEISKEVQIVKADQDKQTAIIAAEAEKQQDIVKAEGQKQQTVLVAEGDLAKAQLNAKGIEAEGAAKGAAEQAILMAPVNSQITLAKEIGANSAYQQYLISVRRIEKDEKVGIEQAKALGQADIKVIANTGDVVEGVSNVMDLFTTKGGTQLGGMVEAFKQTPAGAEIVRRITGDEVA